MFSFSGLLTLFFAATLPLAKEADAPIPHAQQVAVSPPTKAVRPSRQEMEDCFANVEIPTDCKLAYGISLLSLAYTFSS
jgi:hypothetical protein